MRFNTSTYILKGLILMVLFLGQTSLEATHIVGGDISYKCLGDSFYEVTLTVRRDCDNGDPEAFFDDPASVGIFTGTGSLLTSLGESGQILMPFTSADTIDINGLDGCVFDDGDVCVHESVYKSEIYLPFRNGGYILAYQRCCRNATLLNIDSPLETGSTYVARLNEFTLTHCNNSAAFNDWPDIFLCAGQQLTFDHSATDIDGDSLVYKLCTPTSGASIDFPIPQPPNHPNSTTFPYYDEVVWSGANFSETNMLGAGTPLTINPTTGVLTAVPGQIGQFLVGVCVEEYRDGSLINIIKRDFEYNIVPCSDPVVSDFEFEGLDCDELTYQFTNTTQNGINVSWNFDFPSNDPAVMSDEENPIYTFPEEGVYTVSISSENLFESCTDVYSEEITIVQGGFDIDFDISLSNCGESSVDVLLEDASEIYDPTVSISSYEWLVLLDGVQTNTTNSASIDLNNVFFETIEVQLTIVTNKGCKKTISETFLLQDLLPQVDFEVTVLQCYANGFQFEVSDISSILNGDINAEMWMWTVSDVSNSTMLMGQTIVFDALSPVTIELEVKFDNGCFGYATKTIDPYEDLAPEVNILPSVDGCDFDNNMLDLNLEVELIGGSFAGTPSDYSWTILEDGTTTNLSGQSVDYTYMNTDNSIEVAVLVSYSNGCQFSKTMTYSSEDILPQIDFVYSNITCHPDGTIDLDITASYAQTAGFDPNSYSWIITNGGTQTFNGETISLTINSNEALNIDLTVAFDNGCVININEDVNIVGEITPDPSWDVTITNCDDPNNLTLVLSNTTDYDAANLVSLVWNYTINGSNFSSSDNPLEIMLGLDDEVSVSLTTNYDNGCSGTTIESPFDTGYPSIEFFADPLFVCMGMETALVANPNSDWTYTWSPTTGLSFDSNTDFSNPTVTVTEDIVYSVTVTNGACTITNEVSVTVTQESEILVAGEGMVCDGQYSLSVANPVAGGNYIWSDDIDFINIIGTGTSISGTTPGGPSYTVYVMLEGDNENCLVGTTTIELIDNSINVDIIEPFMLCYGDTAQYIVLNNDPNQILSFTWNDDHIVDGANTNTPTVGVGLEDEEFEMEVSIENQFGCTLTDFVTVLVGEAPDLSFTYDYEECGDLTVCFLPSGNVGNLYIWNFGDEASGSDNEAIGSEVCHTFSNAGDFTISLTGVGSICAGNSYEETITIFSDIDIFNLGVEVDSVSTCATDSLILTATSNGPDELITWCDGAGTEVFVGTEVILYPQTNELTGLPEGFVIDGVLYNTSSLTAKIVASENCTITDEVSIEIYDFGPGSEFEDLFFDVLYEDCGGLTVCFEANTDAAGTLEWDFGDGSMMSGDQNTCHTYEAPETGSGTYDVVLCAPEAPCPVDCYSMTIVVSEEPFVTVLGAEADGIVNYCLGESVELEATTNADMGDIQWCIDGEVVGTGPTYIWMGEGEEQISVKLDGGDDCIDTTLVNIIPYDFGPGTENDTLSFTASLEECGGTTVCFEANTNAAGFLIWDFGDGTVVTGDQFPCHDYGTTGTFTVSLAAPDAPCEVVAYSEDITILGFEPEIDIDLEIDTLNYCLGDTALVTVISNLEDEFISWCNPLGVEVGTGGTFEYSDSTSVWLYAKADDGLGCVDIDSIYIGPYDFGPGTENDTLFFTATRPDCGSSVVCFEANTNADGNLIWDFGDSTVIPGDQMICHDYALTGSGKYDVVLTAPDAPCPVVGYEECIIVSDIDPMLEIVDQVSDCMTDMYTITATSNLNDSLITWCDSLGLEIGSGPIFNIVITQETMISAKIDDGLGCGDTIDIVLLPQMMDSLFIDLGEQDCSGDPFVVSVQGTNAQDYEYVWSPTECILGDTTGQFITIDTFTTLSKLITVLVTDPGSGCTMELTETIYPGLEGLNTQIISSVGDTLCRGEEVTLTLVPYSELWEVEWSTADTNVEEITDSPEESTTYTVTITDQNGCELIVEFFLEVTQPTCTEEDVFIPTAFSPNGDGTNDLLFVRSKFIDEMELKIVNRWGEVVFITTDQNQGWDGTYEGEELAPDVFAYWLSVSCINGSEYLSQGNVSIIR